MANANAAPATTPGHTKGSSTSRITRARDALVCVQVVVGRLRQRRRFRLPDVDADRDIRHRLAVESLADDVCAFVVESHAVDECLVLAESEQSRSGIPGLPLGRHAADLHVSESERRERARYLCVLIEPRGHADRVRKRVLERLDP
jgi:hypothetical protein